MTAKWIVKSEDPKRLKEFLKDKGVSRRIIGRVKFHGGSFEVNGSQERVRRELFPGDIVQLNLPIEEPNPYLLETHGELEILFEDDYFIIINKPIGLISVPSPAHREDTVASRVKGYFMRNNYRHQIVHVVTRLDRFTSGVMIVAKNMLAHSLMADLLSKQELEKYYEAIVEGHFTEEEKEGLIDAPIARSPESIIERMVSPEGKPSITEYKVLEELPNDLTHVRLALHTGRTHQIRVHMSHIGHPLVGDDLYGGSLTYLDRQALHCKEYKFIHPITHEKIHAQAPLPADMEAIISGKMVK